MEYKKLKSLAIALVMATVGLARADVALGAEAACQELGGGVVFKDTLYGLGTGLLFTGLTMVALDNYEQQGRQLAIGGLVGSGVGFGVGVIEMLMRDCNAVAAAPSLKPGWQRPSLASVSLPNSRGPEARTGYAFGLSYVFSPK